MALNDFVDIQAHIAPAQVAHEPTVDRHEQVNIGLEYAKRQAETPAPEQKPIPSAGAIPIPN